MFAIYNVLKQDDQLSTKVKQVFENQVNYMIWCVYKNLYSTITASGGTLFGGCVRDLKVREEATSDFYDRCRHDHINADVNYSFSDIFPETYVGRRTLPNDIDLFIPEDKVDTLEENIKKLGSTFPT